MVWRGSARSAKQSYFESPRAPKNDADAHCFGGKSQLGARPAVPFQGGARAARMAWLLL